MSAFIGKMKINYNCEDFQKSLQKFWQADQYCDVVLFGADRKTKIPAHRVVLAAFSPYFAEQAPNVKKIVVGAMDGSTLQRLVGACYSGTLEMDENNVSSLYMGAIHLQLNNLLTAMDNYIVTQLNESNCLYFYNLAKISSRSVLIKAAENYICKHIIEITDQPAFLELDIQKLKDLLGLEGLLVSSAEGVFRNVLKWIRHDPDGKRDDVVPELLPILRLSSMSSKFLLGQVRPLCKTVATNELIFAALKKQLEFTPTVSATALEKQVISNDIERPPPTGDVKNEKLIAVISDFPDKPEIMEYSYDRKMWTTIATLPKIIRQFSVVHSMALNSLCFIGGVDSNLTVLSDVLLWNCKTRKFKELDNMIEPRCNPGVTSLYGGGDDDGDLIVEGVGAISKQSTLERWSRKSGKWRFLPFPNESKFGGRLVSMGNIIYCIGGNNRWEDSKSLKCYNRKGNLWSTLASLHHARHLCGTLIDGGKLYIIGGGSDVIECYEAKKNEWKEVCNVEGSACVTTCVRHNDRLYAFGYATVLTSNGDWKKWKKSDIIEAIDDCPYGVFSIPPQ